MRIPVLTYHANNISGNDYANNDHVAFASDLALVTQMGWRVMPLHVVVDELLVPREQLADKVLAITFDDGTDFDFHDLAHPSCGTQRSMINIMRDFAADHPGGQPFLHATSFVIASPEARTAMDRLCMIGRDWMNETWWPDAVSSGLMGIANHSWDHNHECLEAGVRRGREKGNFHCIDTYADADAEIRDAAHYIAGKAPNKSVSLFGYPYGHVNDFLRREYFPRQALSATSVTRAAFGTEPGMIAPGSDRWNLPRYVCGWHWKSSDELRAILRS
jgi:Polysaccharide deacetylase